MSIFDRGDYRTFIVVAAAGDTDRALYAFPVFEGELVSDVFNYYRYLYFPDTAQVQYRRGADDLDNELSLGLFFADVTVDRDKFIVSTLRPSNLLWTPVVTQWEDQWVFDHLMATTGRMPETSCRYFKGGRTIQAQVNEVYGSAMRRMLWTAATCFVAVLVLMSSDNDAE